jgi:hypothetical protein
MCFLGTGIKKQICSKKNTGLAGESQYFKRSIFMFCGMLICTVQGSIAACGIILDLFSDKLIPVAAK